MSYEEVMDEYNSQMELAMMLFNIIIFVFILFLIVALIVIIVKGRGESKFHNILEFSIYFSFGLVGFLVTTVSITVVLDTEGIEEKWELEYVKPYIENLPVTKKELIYVKVDPEYKVENPYSNQKDGRGHIDSKLKTVYLIGYLNEEKEIVTETVEVKVKMSLAATDKPYIQYQILKKDFNQQYEKGKYNMQIYLPENYTFDSIK